MSASEDSQPSTSCSEVNNLEPRQSTSSDEPPAKRHLYVSEIKEMWNLVKVFRKLGTREQAIAFAEERGMIPRSKMCHYHKKPMLVIFSTNKTVGYFVCNKRVCKNKTRISRSTGTWFENIKIEMSQIFYIMYAYASKWTYDMTIKEDFSERENCLSRGTINDWFNYCREAVVIYQIDKQTFEGKIGGPGKIVQIDESKFGKRKYNKGRRIEGHWVLGMIEDGSEDLRLEICPDNVRSSDILIPLIKKHVAEGSIIHTDMWRAYNDLGNHGFTHKRVNHSDPDNPFVAPDGTHTQRIESQWRIVKRFFVKDNFNNRENFTDLIYEYLWRREIIKLKEDPFEKLIDVINYVYK
ncbi:unnamed protein product [Euphydryas editha]|uniref:ISXO2-like transposase domain-containing protein n=1 Tax=Euphydryas editha TaxID=104508 RepID=A0AAU9TMX7_EUPED|nr:unnamed protein product [Euphydryas editha]